MVGKTTCLAISGMALSALVLLGTGGCARREGPITVGSKNFTEQVLLGEIVAQHIEKRLAKPVERRLNIGGTLLAHQALTNGDIDMYPEYTGAALMAVLKLSMVPDPQAVLERVRDIYKTSYQVEWMDPLGFSNSFAMVVRAEDAEKWKLKTLSDASGVDEGWRLGGGYEFTGRPDGFPALNNAYKLNWTAAPVTMDLGLLYRALQQKQVNMIAANSTDGQLVRLKLVALEDDKRAFPPYQAALAVRMAAFAKDAKLRAALAELSGKFSEEKMRRMNYAIDGEKQPVAAVAREFLREAGL